MPTSFQAIRRFLFNILTIVLNKIFVLYIVYFLGVTSRPALSIKPHLPDL